MPFRDLVIALGALLAAGCVANAAQPSVPAPHAQPQQSSTPLVPPTPNSVTRDEPGGDAPDPHAAALVRQLSEPWGKRSDKDYQVHVPLTDRPHWKRVRFTGVDHLAGFRYGKDGHAVTLVVVQALEPGDALTSRSCLRRFELWARPQLNAYDVRLESTTERKITWRSGEVFIRLAEGAVNFGFSRRQYSTAWAAYPAYPRACLVYAIAIPWDTQPGLAQRVRDRWVREAFEQVETLTPEPPYRH